MWATAPDPLPDFGTDRLSGEAFHRACTAVREVGPVVEVPFHGGMALFLTCSEDTAQKSLPVRTYTWGSDVAPAPYDSDEVDDR